MKGALSEIRHGQIELNRRLDKLEENFNSALVSQRITELESRIQELENLVPLIDKSQKQLSDHTESLK